ncbi:hypothetical protein PanWU01x14_237510 [Parasponia andersonii]|uniref:Uncharacterized protein n=1 Tax=Parasponia andersonii TaxID=3476 RepID=A0A2P5BHW5_PARAD|nr:hypothetical protein PanWU01x14_237510 [Parasponia andersonii]
MGTHHVYFDLSAVLLIARNINRKTVRSSSETHVLNITIQASHGSSVSSDARFRTFSITDTLKYDSGACLIVVVILITWPTFGKSVFFSWPEWQVAKQ